MAGAVGHAEGSPDSIHISHIGVRDHSTRDHHLGPVSCEFTGKPESKVKLRLKPGHSQMGCCYLKQHLKHCAKHIQDALNQFGFIKSICFPYCLLLEKTV